MKLNKSIKTTMSLAAFAAFTGSASAATIITVENAGFESPGVSTNKKSGSDNDWDGTDDVPGWNNAGTTYGDSGTTQEGGGSHSGDYASKIGNTDDGLLQLTGHTVATGEEFTLSFWVDDTWKAGTGASATLYFGTPANVIGTYDFGTSTAWVQHSFNATAVAAADGGTLGILFEGTSTFAKIDDVELTYTAVPEPTTTALLGLGGLALILRRRT